MRVLVEAKNLEDFFVECGRGAGRETKSTLSAFRDKVWSIAVRRKPCPRHGFGVTPRVKQNCVIFENCANFYEMRKIFKDYEEFFAIFLFSPLRAFAKTQALK